MTRARAKLLEQQVNSLLAQPDICLDENFILPKSLHLCMIRFEEFVARNEAEQRDMELDVKNTQKCAREEREAGAAQLDDFCCPGLAAGQSDAQRPDSPEAIAIIGSTWTDRRVWPDSPEAIANFRQHPDRPTRLVGQSGSYRDFWQRLDSPTRLTGQSGGPRTVRRV